MLGDDTSFEGTHLNKLPALESLSLRPHLIPYFNYNELIMKSKDILTSLMLDCDELEWECLQAILNKISPEKLTGLKLYYCEYYPNETF